MKPKFYLPELDVLRFFAFLLVFVHHSLPGMPDVYTGIFAPFANLLPTMGLAGAFGVDLFFALSAYLITTLLLKERAQTGKINGMAFYLRRALRIFPLFYVFVLLSIFVFPYIISDQHLELPHILGLLFFTENYVVAAIGYPRSVANPLWSVSIEEQFYLFFPLAITYFKIINLQKLAFILLGVAFVTRLILYKMMVTHPAVWTNTFSRLDPIALGIILAVNMYEGKIKPLTNNYLRALLIGIGYGGYLFSASFLTFDGKLSLITYPLNAAASILIVYAAILPFDLRGFRPLIYLGKISYGLYVIHSFGLVVAHLITTKLDVSLTYFPAVKFIIGLAVTIALAALSYAYLEKPFLKLKSKLAVIDSRSV